nr:3'-5' exonuclease [Maliibacterium massiliense]
MTYIVMDLEWNQKNRSRRKRKAVNEIIEFGAVKYDGCQRKIDTFHAVVRPAIYQGMHPTVERIVQLDGEQLRHGETFQEVMTRFAAWCGEDFALLSWGNEDAVILMENLAYYALEVGFVDRYFNLQQLFSQQLEVDGRAQRGLRAACEMLQIEVSESFHSALYDALCAGEIFTHIDLARAQAENSGAFILPKRQQEAMFLRYLTAMKQWYGVRAGALSCPACGARTKQVVDWFALSGGRAMVIARCGAHGYFSCVMPWSTRPRVTGRGAQAGKGTFA